MFRILLSRSVCLLSVLCVVYPAFAASASDASIVRIPATALASPAQPVPAWDPGSPQRLFRIEGSLYQEDAGFYYRVIDDSISVRLGDGIESWDGLIERAEASTQAALRQLVALRTNRLGTVDLELPDRDPIYWCELIHGTGLVKYAEVAAMGVWAASPDDPLYSTQWALNNTGQTGGTPGADMKAEAAWEITSGNPAVIVGILDSGTDTDHVDLESNIWVNEDEIPGNDIDDDGNGFVDDVNGWDFAGNDANPNGSNWHGTHVAGTIIAIGDNDTGLVGLAGGLGTPGARGLIVKVGDAGPIGTIIDDSILYAADNGAKVITLSLTVPETTDINDALDYAYNQKDVFIDCAAGNNGSSVSYPARRPEVVAVASTDHNDRRSSFSNPGSELEVAAPGTDIRSTQPNDSYGISSGTSFAAPYVAALAALIRGLAPGLPAADVRQLMIDTVDDVESPGFDTLTGHGRINAHTALLQTGSPDGTIELDADAYSCNAEFQVTIEDIDLAGDGVTTITVKSGLEPLGEDLLLTEVGSGVFEGSMEFGAGGPAPDGVLQVQHGDLVTAEYVDFHDGQGGAFVLKTDSAALDCLGPLISGVGTTGIDDTSATIVWTTDEPSTSRVRYGEVIPPVEEPPPGLAGTFHSVTITGLDPCTNYLFEVESVDGLNNLSADDNSGFYYSFQTLGDFPGVGLSACQLGQPLLGSNRYGCDEVVSVTVTDLDLDEDPDTIETVSVLMTSTTEPDGEWITLTESGLSSNLFEGTVELDGDSTSGDGRLGASANDLITVTYRDEDDGSGSSRIATFTSLADCVGPSIENLRVTAISSTRAEIEWTSDEPSSSRVEFGPTSTLGAVSEDLELTTEHRLVVSAFDACDRVHFTVSGTDATGTTRLADAGGQPLQFNLNRIGGLLFHDNFETDTGWTLGGEWERATPLALGSGSGDPSIAYSGSAILGTDLTGSGVFPGDYEPIVSQTAQSPAFSTSGVPGPELIIRRKLGVMAADDAKITLNTVFSQAVWTSSDAVDDDDWTEVRYDIDGGGNLASLRISFVMDSHFPNHAYGWNIDEIVVKDSTQPDYLACADCNGTPAFSGLKEAYDPDPCASSGVALEWDPAPAWGTGGGGTYEVHRSTDPAFVPDETNRIAAGLTGTDWTDASAPVDTAVWYVVRVRNDEACDGGIGLTDGNSLRLQATETVSQSSPTSVGDTLRVTSVGLAHVRLGWDPVAGASEYVVRRSQSNSFDAEEELGSTSQTFFEDANAATNGNLYFYRVFSRNACGEEAR
jgi:subtilisin family serine protease